MKYHVAIDGEEIEVELKTDADRTVAVVNGEEHEVDFRPVNGTTAYSLLLGRLSRPISFENRPDGLSVTVESESYLVRVEDDRARAAREVAGDRGSPDHSKVVLSMMPGIVRAVLVEPGAEVTAGQPLLILEAMKMENEIRAALTGTVKTVHVEADQTVNKGDALVTLE